MLAIEVRPSFVGNLRYLAIHRYLGILLQISLKLVSGSVLQCFQFPLNLVRYEIEITSPLHRQPVY